MFQVLHQSEFNPGIYCIGGVVIEAITHWFKRQVNEEEKKETRCLCCGQCCESFGWHLNASKADQQRWLNQGREDLLVRVNRLGWIWTNPQTGQPEERCPFLERLDEKTVVCGIQETKPDICRSYPTLAHGRRCLRGVFLRVVVPVAVCGACEFEAVANSVWC